MKKAKPQGSLLTMEKISVLGLQNLKYLCGYYYFYYQHIQKIELVISQKLQTLQFYWYNYLNTLHTEASRFLSECISYEMKYMQL